MLMLFIIACCLASRITYCCEERRLEEKSSNQNHIHIRLEYEKAIIALLEKCKLPTTRTEKNNRRLQTSHNDLHIRDTNLDTSAQK